MILTKIMRVTKSFPLTNDSFETIPQIFLAPAPNPTFRCKTEKQKLITEQFTEKYTIHAITHNIKILKKILQHFSQVGFTLV